MKTWEDYKIEAKKISPMVKEDIEMMETIGEIIGAIIAKRYELNITQRELANMCGLPHSSVARIETYTVVPRIETLLKIMRSLGLTLEVKPL